MQPQEVLELIQSAPTRYETVRAVLRYRGDGSMIKTVHERFVRSAAYTRTFGEPPEKADEASDPEPDGPFGWRCKVWRIDNHRWRQETGLPAEGWTSGPRLAVCGHAGPLKARPVLPKSGIGASVETRGPKIRRGLYRTPTRTGPCILSTPRALRA